MGLRSIGTVQRRQQLLVWGGKAQVIGIARAPIGLAGVNGLIELTVIADDVPLLLPIKLLKQLRAVVDMDRHVLEILSFGVEAPMSELPSGHVAVSVTDFAPEGWSVPAEALSAKLCKEQFVLMSNNGVGHSMNELKSFVSVSPPAVGDNGFASYGAAVGPARGRCDPETAKEYGRKAERPYEAHRTSRTGARLTAKSSSLQLLGLASSPGASLPSTRVSAPSTPIKTKQADAQLECSEVIKCASFLGVRQSKEKPNVLVTACVHFGSLRRARATSTRGRSFAVLGLPVGTVGASIAGGAAPEKGGSGILESYSVDSHHECRLDDCESRGRTAAVPLQEASIPLAGEEKGPDHGQAFGTRWSKLQRRRGWIRNSWMWRWRRWRSSSRRS